MKTLIKIAAVITILVVILFIGLITFGLSQVNAGVKLAIEKGGTYATQTTTTVDTVEIGLTDGSFAMNGFNINNPDGFDTAHFLKLNSTAVTLDPASILSDTISVPTVTFDGLDVILDKGQDPSNYNAILAALQRFESGEKAPQEPAPSGKPAKTVAIDSLILKDINIHLANMPGIGFVAGDIAINIPQIELQDIGKDDPMSIPEIVNLVVKTVITAAVESGGGIIPNDILGELGNGLGALTSLGDMGITAIGGAGEIVGEQMGAVLENAGAVIDDVADQAGDIVESIPVPDELGEDIGNAVEDAADEIKKGIGGLFGNNEDD